MEQQIAQYFLFSVIINAVIINAATLLIIVAVLAYALVQIRRGNREIIREVGNVGAMTQNVAAMTREILWRTE